MSLADRVKKRRIELGWSQEELANKMGYASRTSINKIENGREVSQKIIVKLAKVLGTTPTYLMGWDEQINEEDKNFIKAMDFKKEYKDDLMDSNEQALKSLLNDMGYDLRYINNEYALFNDNGAVTLDKEEVKTLLNETENFLEYQVNKIINEKTKKETSNN